MLKEETVSERLGDPKFENYTLADDVDATLGPVDFGANGRSAQTASTFAFGQASQVKAQTGGGDAESPGGQQQAGGNKSDSVPGQFYAKPQNGPDPYEGMTSAERAGRQTGEWISGWDSGREVYERNKEIIKKRWNGEDVPEKELKDAQHADDKFIFDMLPVPPVLKWGGPAVKRGLKILK